MTERAQFLAEIERIVHSQTLQGSESLCKFLNYLSKYALDHPDERLKEHQIATEVFGRSSDFDSRVDSLIRVQAGRLRAKLASYYETEGSEDSVLVDLPKGSYALSFHHRRTAAARTQSGADHGSDAWVISKRTGIILLAASIVQSAILVAIAIPVASRRSAESAAASEVQADGDPLQTFWKPFISGANEPWVIFSNGSFVGRPETGLRYYDRTKDSGARVWDHYTGVGEVLAMHSLDQLFGSLQRNLQVKRGSLVALDDVKNNDLIFIGSPSENLTLMDIPTTRNFVFSRVPSGPRKGDLAIMNTQPQAGEAEINLASPSNSPLTEDYAIVALVPGINPSRSVLILAGTTTFGTQGAAEFVCRKNSVEELLLRLAVSKSMAFKPFEALLRVKITRGVPVDTELVALRQRSTP